MENTSVNNRWQSAKQKRYKAHIADVDGNLTSEKEKTEYLSDEIVKRIRKKLLAGIPFGVCRARSFRKNKMLDNIKNAVLDNLPEAAAKRFFLFPEQGTSAITFTTAPQGGVTTKEVDLAELFDILPGNKDILSDAYKAKLFDYLNKNLSVTASLEYKSPKKYGFLAAIKCNSPFSDEDYRKRIELITKEVNRLLASAFPAFSASCTRSSVYVAVKGACKELALKYFALLYNISKDEIVGTDDQGEKNGVGWPLTNHKAGFSTNTYDPESAFQIPLSLICGMKGKDAWLFLDDNLSYLSPDDIQ